ncbi:hypothetical protein ACFE04_022277 [Oxalis oulophora]
MGGASHLNSSGKGTNLVSASGTKNKPRSYSKMLRLKFYAAEHAASIREWTMGSMKDKWRSWKNSLKKTCFDFSKSEDDNVKFFVDMEKDWVDPDQYRFVAKYWLLDKRKVTSETNKNNITCYKEPHCACSMAFCRIVENLAKQNDGVKPARSLMYCHTRKNKKRDYTSTIVSTYGDEFRKAITAKTTAREKRNREREENHDLNLDSETSSGEESLDNDNYSKIKGISKKGRINCERHLAALVRKIPKKHGEDMEEMRPLIACCYPPM